MEEELEHIARMRKHSFFPSLFNKLIEEDIGLAMVNKSLYVFIESI